MSAAAATAANQKQAAAASLCTVAKGVAQDIANSTSLSKAEVASPAQLKAIYGAIAAAEPALKASTPGALKPDMTSVLSFVNIVIADLKQVSWNAKELAPKLVPLEGQVKQVEPHLKRVTAYLRGPCHLDV